MRISQLQHATEADVRVGLAAKCTVDRDTLSRVAAELRGDGITFLNPVEGSATGLPRRPVKVDDLIKVWGDVYAIDALGETPAMRCRAMRFDGTGRLVTAPTPASLDAKLRSQRIGGE